MDSDDDLDISAFRNVGSVLAAPLKRKIAQRSTELCGIMRAAKKAKACDQHIAQSLAKVQNVQDRAS